MNELHALLKWLLMIFSVSLLMRPYLCVRRLKLWDKGFAVSFGLGTAVSFFLCFFAAAALSLKFDTILVYFSFALIAILGILLKYYVQKDDIKALFIKNIRSDLGRYLLGFLLFTFVFVICVWIKGFKPGITSTTEQYMDYGFVQSIFRQKSVIPEDIWYSGQSLNYYYLGQAATAYLCRLSGITPDFGYPFMMCTILSALFSMVLSLSSAMIEGKITSKIIGGLSASFMTCFAGNGHYIYYGIIVPIIEKITGNMTLRYSDYGYFFPDSTTYIGHNQVIEDYGKHEFPAYSYVIGDLHAHVINLLFVIPLLVLLIDYAYETLDDFGKKSHDSVNITQKTGLVNSSKLTIKYIYNLIDARLLLIGALFGLFMGSNYWDFPIYFIICGGVILFSDFAKDGIKWGTFGKVLLKGLYMLIIGYLLILPFDLHFTKMASEICLCKNHSPLYKILLIWAFPTGVSLWFLIYLLKKNKKSDMMCRPKLMVVMLALVPCAIGLIIMPEVVYVKDIYGEAYARFNTMFKLTYQAFVLTGLVIGIAIGVWLENKKSLRGVILFCCCIVFSSYICVAIDQFMGNIFDYGNRKSSNATEFLLKDPNLSAQMNSIRIINSDERNLVHVLECGGSSYQPDDMISVFTGAPTYVGWGVHEWMWRNGWDPIGIRQGEVSYFYNAGDFDYCSQFIKNNKIDYIFVGPREYFYYEPNFSGFENLVNITEVYKSEDNLYRLYKVE